MKTEPIDTEEALDHELSTPPQSVVDMMRRLDGDFIILGIAGKMGVNLGMMVVRATRAAGVSRRVIGVSRFSDPGAREKLEAFGVETISCDLLSRDAVDRLPAAANVVFMAGKKFGTGDDPSVTWAMNTLAAGYVAERYAQSRLVAYSTGCVYDFVPPSSHGSRETDLPAPVGDYAQSALGRERIFSYYANTRGMRTAIVRLNYAIDLRYGVLHDIAQTLVRGEPLDLGMGYVNVIWQGDAIAYSLRCFEACASPAAIVNVAGPEIIPVRSIAEELAARLGVTARFSGSESPSAYLNNAEKSYALFGRPRMPYAAMLDLTAAWTRSGGRSLNKPTHFETKNGRF